VADIGWGAGFGAGAGIGAGSPCANAGAAMPAASVRPAIAVKIFDFGVIAFSLIMRADPDCKCPRSTALAHCIRYCRAAPTGKASFHGETANGGVCKAMRETATV
jgi:hypothetical protein